jgi:hypothetical protein
MKTALQKSRHGGRATDELFDTSLDSNRHGAWRSLVSAPVWGTGGPEFKSRRPDEKKAPHRRGFRLANR